LNGLDDALDGKLSALGFQAWRIVIDCGMYSLAGYS
jgi:hypothetical protein